MRNSYTPIRTLPLAEKGRLKFLYSVQSAAICAELGDKDRAFESMEKALAVRDERLLWIKVDPRLDNLRTDERYSGLLRRMNLPK